MDHTIVHFEIPADNVEKLKKFYAGVFGWKIEKAPGPMEYWLIETVPVDEKMTPLRLGVNGGLYKKENTELKPVNYFSVENIDQFITKITEARWKNHTTKTRGPKRRLDSTSNGSRNKPVCRNATEPRLTTARQHDKRH